MPLHKPDHEKLGKMMQLPMLYPDYQANPLDKKVAMVSTGQSGRPTLKGNDRKIPTVISYGLVSIKIIYRH